MDLTVTPFCYFYVSMPSGFDRFAPVQVRHHQVSPRLESLCAAKDHYTWVCFLSVITYPLYNSRLLEKSHVIQASAVDKKMLQLEYCKIFSQSFQ